MCVEGGVCQPHYDQSRKMTTSSQQLDDGQGKESAGGRGGREWEGRGEGGRWHQRPDVNKGEEGEGGVQVYTN